MTTMRRLVAKMFAPSTFALCVTAGAPFEAAAGPQGDPCDSGWVGDLFSEPAGVDGTVGSMLVFDDGSGPALFVTGAFSYAGPLLVNGMAKWDGAGWSKVPGSEGGSFGDLKAFDDGSGPAMYAAASLTLAGGTTYRGVARWNGAAWTPIGSGFDTSVSAIAFYDHGSGPALYAAGAFTRNGNTSFIERIAKWNGAAWVSLGWPQTGPLYDMVVYDDGSGPALFVAGNFVNGAGSSSHIARWNGATWSAVGVSPNNAVNALAVFNDGSGPALFAGGIFNGAGGAPASRIAKWNGAAWSPLGSGVNGNVASLTSIESAGESHLYVGGVFSEAGGVPVGNLARWDGSAWTSVAGGVAGASQYAPGTPNVLTLFDDGSGPLLYVGGVFETAGGKGALNIARGDGEAWWPLGPGMDKQVYALEVSAGGLDESPALYVGGTFNQIEGVTAKGVARWDGAQWSAVGSGPGSAYCLETFDSGSGPELYAGGPFNIATGAAFDRIAKWDGNSWTSVGGGVNGIVYALQVYTDPIGPALYVGGNFNLAGGVSSNRIARWNGATWSAVPGLGAGSHNCGLLVEAMLVYDDGTGPALYVAGKFQKAGALTVNNIAKWNGLTWSGFGSGFPDCSEVRALAIYDDGAGPALYAGGAFRPLSGPGGYLAKWNGASWQYVGGDTDLDVAALKVFDDGSGSSLFAAGFFAAAGGAPAAHIAKWDGSIWTCLGSGIDRTVRSLAVFDEGAGPALFAGGDFGVAGEKLSGRLAKWTGCAVVPPLCLGDANGDNLVNFDDINATIASWLANYGAGTGPGDSNGDGVVNFDDISTTIANWLADCGA